MDLDFGRLLLSLLISSAGLVLFLYGKKQTRIPQIVAGIVLMAYPYFVPTPWIMAATAVAVLGLLWGALRLGY